MPDPASTNTSFGNAARPIATARTFGSAPCCPGRGVTYYDVPSEYGVHGYRYTVVNDRTVLVDPATGRIVEVID